MMKKLAIPTREGMVDDHFGHCAYYTVVTLNEQNQVVNQERLDSPEGCGCLQQPRREASVCYTVIQKVN